MVAAVEDTEEPTQISQPEDTSRTQSETPKMSSTGKVLSLKAPEPLPAEGGDDYLVQSMEKSSNSLG